MTGNLDTCEDKITQLNEKITTQVVNITHRKETLKKIGTEDEQCPVCLKPIADHDKEHINQEKKIINDEISKSNKDIAVKNGTLDRLISLKTNLKASIKQQNALLSEHNVKINESKTVQKNIDQLNEWNSEIEVDIKNLNKENKQFDGVIEKQKGRLDEIQSKINNIQHSMGILDVVKFVVSEEGVKSYIVKKILQVFNSKLAYYLSKMDANCLCIFNEYFEEEIVDEKGKVCSYYNFSGAERKNIDLACLFAFMDIRRLQGSVAYNFSVYDELLDSSLDERGVDLVLNILRERVEQYNECIMIISHRKESVKIGSHYKNPGEVIFLQKENGITRRVEFKEEES